MKLKFQKMEKYTEGESEKKDEGKKEKEKGTWKTGFLFYRWEDKPRGLRSHNQPVALDLTPWPQAALPLTWDLGAVFSNHSLPRLLRSLAIGEAFFSVSSGGHT